MKLLALVAHPDDAAIFCGGTLAKHAERGDDVHVIYLTRGELGTTDEDPNSNRPETRSAEARAACEELGADASFLGFRDGRIDHSLENRGPLMDEIRRHQPELILTHHRDDPHPDHRATGRLVTDAYYQSSLPAVRSDHDPWESENVFYFGKPTTNRRPDCYVDISDVWNRKRAAIRCHESQLEFLRNHGGIDSGFDDPVADLRAEARTYGRRCNVRYAEAFAALHDPVQEYLG